MSTRVRGPVYAKVSDNKDPEKMGRIKVSFELIGDTVETGWLDVMSTYGGSFFVPEVGDQVVVAFYGGNTSAGVVLGNIWTQSQQPPQMGLGGAELNSDGKNTNRYLRTKGGNRIAFNDMPGNVKMQFVNQQSINQIDFIAKKKHIKLKSRNKVVIEAAKTVKIKAEKGNFEFKKNLLFKAKKIVLQAGKNVKLEANQLVEMKGKKVKLN